MNSITVGQVYQSIDYPNIMRKVVRVSRGMVVYSISDKKRPSAFHKMATAAESVFLRTSKEVDATGGKK